MQSSTQPNSEHATIASMLWWSIDHNVTTRKQLAIAADSSEEMVARVLSGQPPKLLAFRRWVSEGSPLPKSLKQMLMGWFLRPTGHVAVGRGLPADELLDHNGDGLIDARDVLALKIDAACKGTEAMGALSLAMLDGQLTEAEKAKVRSLLNETAALIERASQALDHDDQRNGGGNASMRVAG